MVIIGAGPGGSTAAILLAKRGYKVDVYERRPQPKQDPIDLKRTYIIALSERGLKPMRAAGVSIPSDAPYKGFVRHLKGGKVQVTHQHLAKNKPMLPDHMCVNTAHGAGGATRSDHIRCVTSALCLCCLYTLMHSAVT